MRYHNYKHKPGGYIRRRNRFGGYSTIPNAHKIMGGGCCGCLIPCLCSVFVIGMIIAIF